MGFIKILFFIAVFSSSSSTEKNHRSCLKKNDTLINSEEFGEFLLLFLRHFNWGSTVILTTKNSRDVIKQFSAASVPIITRSASDTDFHTLTRFHSVIVVTNPQTVFKNLTEIVANHRATPFNWLIIIKEEALVQQLSSAYLPPEFRIIFAVMQNQKRLKLVRVYSKELGMLATVKLGYWYTDEKILRIKRVSIPLPSLTYNQLRITTVKFPPHFSPEYLLPSNGGEPHGIFGEILHILKQRMNFTYVVEEPQDHVFGNKINDTHFSGMVGRLLSNVSDVLVAMGMSTDRLTAVDFSHAVSKIAVKFIYRNRQDVHWRFFFFREPFSPAVWLSLNALALIVAVLLLTTNEYNLKSRKSAWSSKKTYSRFKTLMWYIQVSIYTQLRTGFNYRTSGTPAKIVLQVFHVFCFMIYIHYTTVLTSTQTVNTKTVQFRSVENVLDDSDYNFATLTGTSGIDIISSAKSGVYKRIWQNLQKNPGRYMTKTLAEGKDLIYSEKCVFILDENVLAMLIRGNCSLEFGEQNVYDTHLTFAYRKEFRYKNMFNKYLQLMVESGIVKKIREKYAPPNQREVCKIKGWKRGLDRFSIIGLFVIMIFAIILSIFVLCLEIFFHYFFSS